MGSSGSTTYSGTLSAVTCVRFCRVTTITGTTGAGLETFTDNGSGILTSDKGVVRLASLMIVVGL